MAKLEAMMKLVRGGEVVFISSKARAVELIVELTRTPEPGTRALGAPVLARPSMGWTVYNPDGTKVRERGENSGRVAGRWASGEWFYGDGWAASARMVADLCAVAGAVAWERGAETIDRTCLGVVRIERVREDEVELVRGLLRAEWPETKDDEGARERLLSIGRVWLADRVVREAEEQQQGRAA